MTTNIRQFLADKFQGERFTYLAVIFTIPSSELPLVTRAFHDMIDSGDIIEVSGASSDRYYRIADH